MLTLEQLLQAKSHPEYFKLVYSDNLPNNENWVMMLDTTCENAFALAQIETMIALKSIIQAFPMVRDVGLMACDMANNGYYPLKLFLTFDSKALQQNTFHEDTLDQLLVLNPKATATVDALKQLLPKLVTVTCGTWWNNWAERSISGHAPWNPKKDINKTYKEVMKEHQELVVGLERLSLSQTLPKASHVKSKTKKKL